MIPSKLPIADIAERLGGDVVSSNMARVPAEGAPADDRSLSILKAGPGLIVMPPVGEAGARGRHAAVEAATLYVRRRLSA